MASAITTSGGDLDPQTAIELRLRRLEALLHGTPTSVITTDEGNPSLSTTDVGGGVQRRTHELRDALERVPAAKGHEALRRFITHYDTFTPVLFPKYSKTEELASAETTSSIPTEEDLLPPLSKVSIILQAEQDVVSLEKSLREVELLHKRDVDGAGDLGAHEQLKSRMENLLRRYVVTSASQQRKEARAGGLLERYDDYITTTSEVFVRLNNRVAALEDAVAKLEKRKRDERAETY